MSPDLTQFRPLRDVAAEYGFNLPTAKHAAHQHDVPIYRIPGDRRLFIRATDAAKLNQPVRLPNQKSDLHEVI